MPTSQQKISLDNRLLEIEELYRQRKPDIAHEKIKLLQESDFQSNQIELAVYKYLVAFDLFNSGNYKESETLALAASKLLATTAFHVRVGRIQLLLYRINTEFGRYQAAETFAHDALAFFRRADDQTGMIGSLNGLARINFVRCNFGKSIEYINEAIEHSRGDNVRMAELIGNLGRVEILNGDWEAAEEHLKTALKLAKELDQPLSISRNHLSLGYLNLRMRQYIAAAREFRAAAQIIEEKELFREKLLLMEYEGELALEMGDIVQAKKILTQARDICRDSIPESSLAAQINRRLAQAELALDNAELQKKTPELERFLFALTTHRTGSARTAAR